MTTHYDVPAALLLPAVAAKLGELEVIKQPEWGEDVKTGANRERPPTQDNWWEMRCAAILRKVARMGPIGVKHLADEFGGPRNRNVRPNRVKTGSRNIVRRGLQQLESAGFVKKTVGRTVENVYGEDVQITKGRNLTNEGQKLLDECAHSIREEAESTVPELSKY